MKEYELTLGQKVMVAGFRFIFMLTLASMVIAAALLAWAMTTMYGDWISTIAAVLGGTCAQWSGLNAMAKIRYESE